MQDKKRHQEKNSDTEGFSNSSDSEESIHYNQFHDDHLREEEKSPRKKEKLPSPKKIADRKYSLQPDRFTGYIFSDLDGSRDLNFQLQFLFCNVIPI